MNIYKLSLTFQWRFLQLSVFFVILLLISPYIADRWLIKTITNFVLLNSILVLLSANKSIRSLKFILIILWLGSVTFSFCSVFFSESDLIRYYDFLETFFSISLLAVMIISILLFIFRSTNVSFDSIFAAFTVYMMIGLFFAFLYTIIEKVHPGSFSFPGNEKIILTDIKNELFYFSMVTIATLGYGDIVPAGSFARTVSVMEAVIGQFFVAVIVAILVGKLISSETRKQ